MKIIKSIWSKITQETWNIAIAEVGADFMPVNIRRMKHAYNDRWFADPFFLETTENCFVVLAEEFIRNTGLGRICKLTIDRSDCKLLRNETLLELESHLSFPNIISFEGKTLIYPENSAAGKLTFYSLSENGLDEEFVINIPAIDPVLIRKANQWYLLCTLPEDACGNVLHVFKSDKLMGPYVQVQNVTLSNNTARRGGNLFERNGHLILPGQICNKHYGEGICFQEIVISDEGILAMNEIKRLYAKQVTKMTGFHTYNVMGKYVVIDGYHYGNEFIHDIYFKVRGLKNM